MRTVYLDCVSGISGDMLLAALIDAGADIDYIKHALGHLPIDPFDISIKTVDKCGVSSKKLIIELHEAVSSTHDDREHNNDYHHHDHDHHDHGHDHCHEHDHLEHHHQHEHCHDHEHHRHDHDHDHHHRKAADIIKMIRASDLPARVKQRSLAIFDVIAKAEGKIHGIDPAEVHFHEVGAMDSIIDTIGICLALESLDVAEILSSAVPTGYGKLKMAHGLYPIPAPATAELLKGIPLAHSPVQGELTTPTGAGVLKGLVSKYGPLGNFIIESIGYGAGTKDFAEVPNVMRVLLGKTTH
ncbi:LarC family nickel insertion protein [Aneurinibacillus sp. Ricciae_BoGa-3]|uniref:LarC family nickel insertion protein n=1 Tax=Aneurinibacillus sp. Ricciae_BoGa-3 TaxID=3022697 RepID=UPI00233F8D2C|nr:LarC family nickel insertion protein [Aneurinibacillus sp. Ricciae_BoGa-3]WCK52581.1 LarC family nickel insertion protein [Aneurinibacillus sp. Ricciae_BoGa-3]